MFGRKSATLSASVRTILDRVAGAIGVCKHVEIAGHADGRGSPEINQRLSDDRARAVRDYLVGRGVPSAALTPVGYGATQPIAPNDHSRDRARNRRASLVAK
jgi:OOP family OmpA-OmpF porin